MKLGAVSKLASALLALVMTGGVAVAETPAPLVRIAELEIDPAQLEKYKAAVKEEMEISDPGGARSTGHLLRRAEGRSSKLRFFEIYKDEAAYLAHIASPHFRKYVEITKDMIRSRKLIETVPIQLSAKK